MKNIVKNMRALIYHLLLHFSSGCDLKNLSFLFFDDSWACSRCICGAFNGQIRTITESYG